MSILSLNIETINDRLIQSCASAPTCSGRQDCDQAHMISVHCLWDCWFLCSPALRTWAAPTSAALPWKTASMLMWRHRPASTCTTSSSPPPSTRCCVFGGISLSTWPCQLTTNILVWHGVQIAVEGVFTEPNAACLPAGTVRQGACRGGLPARPAGRARFAAGTQGAVN